MTSDTKIGLLVGLGVILLAGVLISDHYSVARRQSPAQIVTDLPELRQDLMPDPPTVRSRQGRINAFIESLAAPAAGSGHYNGPLTIHTPQPDPALQAAAPQAQTPRIVWMTSQQSPEEQLLVPGQTQSIPAAAVPARMVHTVVEGDRLASIARRYYGDAKFWQKIHEANRSVLVSPDDLKPGMQLYIPMDSPAPAAPTAPAPSARAQAQAAAPAAQAPAALATVAYQVRENESLSEIARRFYGSSRDWPRLYALNKDVLSDPDHLQPGMTIRVPGRR